MHSLIYSRYHKNNAGLDLTISNLRLKETALVKEIHQQQNLKNDALLQIKRLEHDLHEVVQFIQDPKMLREKVPGYWAKLFTNFWGLENSDAREEWYGL